MLWLLFALIGCREVLEPPVDPPAKNPAAAWERVLRKAVDSHGDVDYGFVAKQRHVLESYVVWVAQDGVVRGKGGPAAHAWWLNTFNALVIYQVIERDVVRSVNEVPSLLPWPGSRFWYGTAFRVDGLTASLWDMGHERITHSHQDYRDLAALVVAAKSGPPARSELYLPDELDGQLDEQMSHYLMTDDGLFFDDDGVVVFNRVFDRYGFEIDLYTHGTDLCTLGSYHTTGRRQRRLQRAAEAGCVHRFADFDWALNRSSRR